ncbi:MAG: NifB/NifX family molybdenum-iron cluster-binding protein [Candidatus Thorarchaeota archaeon]
MTTRVLIPTQDIEGTEIADHFGRAPYFAVIDMDDIGTTIEMKVHPNTGEHSGGRGHAHDNVLYYNPKAIIVQGMGPRGIMGFQSKNIAVLRANSKSVQELIQAFNRNALDELTEGCADAHHK